MTGADIYPASHVDGGAPKWVMREAWPSTNGRTPRPLLKPGSPCAGSVRSDHFHFRLHPAPSRIRRRAVLLVLGRQRPDDARVLVGHGHDALFVPRRWRSWLTHRMTRSVLPAVVRSTARVMHQKRSQILVATLADPIRSVRSPLECFRGSNPSQAAMWRPLSKSSPSPIAATAAVAVLGRTPRIRLKCWQASVVRNTWSIRRSNSRTRSSIWAISPSREERISRHRSVRSSIHLVRSPGSCDAPW